MSKEGNTAHETEEPAEQANGQDQGERLVSCPVDDCDAEPLARGVHMHVYHSEGSGHGPKGEVPDDLNFDDLETVGHKNVEVTHTDEIPDSTARFCPFCGQTAQGNQGVMIHAGQMSGKNNHPEDLTGNYDAQDFPLVEINEAGDVIDFVNDDERQKMADFETRLKFHPTASKGTEYVARSKVEQLANEFREFGNEQVAKKIESELL